MKDLIAIQNSFESDSMEAKTYIKFHRQYGLDASWLNKTIIYENNEYTLIGIKKRGRCAFIVLKTNDNKEVFWEINKCIKLFS